MAKQPVKNTIMDPRLWTQQQALQEIRTSNNNHSIWLKPLWPIRSVNFGDKYRFLRRDMIKALTAISSTTELIQLGYEMFMCHADTPCGSPLCNYCRTRLQKRYIKRALELFGNTPTDDLHFLTVLDDLTYQPAIDAPLRRDYLKSKIKRTLKANPLTANIRMLGAFELDAKSASTINCKPKAQDLLTKHYGMTKLTHVGWMPHLHAIIDTGGLHPDVVKETLRETFTKPYQIQTNRMHKSKTDTENLTRLAGYMLKFKYQYADNVLTDEPCYPRQFDPTIMRRFAEVLISMGCRRGARSFEMSFNL